MISRAISRAARRRAAAFLAACAGLAAPACGDKEPVLARVGSAAVTESEFRREIATRPFARQEYVETLPGRKELLDLLVRRRIVLAEARRDRFARRPDVKKKLAEIEDEFQRQRREAKEQVIVGEYFRHLQDTDLKVTEADVKSFWETAVEVKAAHILVGDEAAALDVRRRLDAGEPFEALAKKLSQDVATGRQGGDLGWIMPGTLVPEFEKALFSLKKGETSAPTASAYGFHVIRKLDERKISAAPLEQSAAKLRAVLEKTKFQAWLEKARAAYDVELDLAALEKMKLREEPPAEAAAAAPAPPAPKK